MGKIRHIKLAHKCVRYYRSDCERLLEACTIGQKEKPAKENLTKEQLVYNAILSMRPQDVLLLKNVRSIHFLYNAEIDTISKLISLTKKDILKYRNSGITTANEIERELNRFGLELSK
jgi:DNA-directed RNA polymerase alpha subunit